MSEVFSEFCDARKCDTCKYMESSGYDCEYKWLAEHDAKVRAEAIDEFLLKLSDEISFRSISDRIGCMEIFRGIAEELKEQKNG